MKFKKKLKLFYFKKENKVRLSIKVSKLSTNEYTFSVDKFESLLNSWKTDKGISFDDNGLFWHCVLKKQSPRPYRYPANYVKLSCFTGLMHFHYRLTSNDMYELEKEYFYQKNNKMYWDDDV